MVKRQSSSRRNRLYSPESVRTERLTAPLSDELAQKHGIGRISLRRGDSVRVLRGDFAGLEGKVERVDKSSGRIYIEGVTREKTAGVSSKLPVHASKVMISKLELSDKWRSGLLTEKTRQG